VSYHQKKFCSDCRVHSREVEFRTLFNFYMCYPCFMEASRENIRAAVIGSRATAASDPSRTEATLASQGLPADPEQIELAWNKEYSEARERRRAIQARMEVI